MAMPLCRRIVKVSLHIWWAIRYWFPCTKGFNFSETDCICDKDGTADCDSYVGHCHCQPNVIGEKCDRCEDDHYGFHSGVGCTACECGFASNSTQCDDHTGECRCKPGVTGRQCDRCQRGFWNYTEEGCSCECFIWSVTITGLRYRMSYSRWALFVFSMRLQHGILTRLQLQRGQRSVRVLAWRRWREM